MGTLSGYWIISYPRYYHPAFAFYTFFYLLGVSSYCQQPSFGDCRRDPWGLPSSRPCTIYDTFRCQLYSGDSKVRQGTPSTLSLSHLDWTQSSLRSLIMLIHSRSPWISSLSSGLHTHNNRIIIRMPLSEIAELFAMRDYTALHWLYLSHWGPKFNVKGLVVVGLIAFCIAMLFYFFLSNI